MRKAVTLIVVLSRLFLTRQFVLTVLIAASAGLSLFIATDAGAQTPSGYYRLQLKNGGKFLDADRCSDQVAMNGNSTFADGACQLWQLVPAGGGWSRLQLKNNGKFLDAVHCSDTVALNGNSTYDNGACQLWRFVPAGGGWSRLQLKNGGKYLDAVHCSDTVAMNGKSTFEDGACQLWRLFPVLKGESHTL